MDDLALVRQLKARIKDLEEGACRFNCRTQKQAFIDGYRVGVEACGNETTDLDDDIAEAMYFLLKGDDERL